MMTKEQRTDLLRRGFEILRTQWDQRKGYWKIVKQSRVSYGWARFGSAWYASEESCQKRIEFIVANNPKQYIDEKNYRP